MEPRTWTTVDKTTWGPGPWQDECDKEQWTDKVTGFPCLIVRSEFSGALCGYVGVNDAHPWYGQHYYPEAPEGETLSPVLALLDAVDVHGGLTYSGACEEGPEATTICHVAPGEPELWWFGFDCAHAFDLSPAQRAREAKLGWEPIRGVTETYRDVAYVKSECASLALQAALVLDGPRSR